MSKFSVPFIDRDDDDDNDYDDDDDANAEPTIEPGLSNSEWFASTRARKWAKAF